MKLKLSKPTNATLSNSAAVLTIVDDDSAFAPAVAPRVVSVGTDKVAQKETPPVAAIDWLLRERTFPMSVMDRLLGRSELPTRLSAGTDGVARQPQGSVQVHVSTACSRDDVVVVGKWWEDVSCDLVGK